MKLSVIVPAHNEEKLIVSSLASIQRALVPAVQLGCQTELIVVDNGSSDRTAELATRSGARVVFEPVRQIARARNAGAAAATGDWLLFIDADCWPEPALISDVLDCIQDGRVMGGGSTVKVEGLPFPLSLLSRLWNGVSRLLGWAAGSFIFCRANAFLEIGGFSLNYYVAEEIDLSIRLKRWARDHDSRFSILHLHPLLTSGRKEWLYTRCEIVGTFWKVLRHPRRFFRDRNLCTPWYDGRR